MIIVRTEEKTEQALTILEKQADILSHKLDAQAKNGLHLANKVTTKVSSMRLVELCKEPDWRRNFQHFWLLWLQKPMIWICIF